MDQSLRTNPRCVFRRMKEGAGGVLLNLDTGEYRRLNETGARIWELLVAGPTYADLLVQLRSEVKDPPDTLEEDVQAFLDELSARELVERGEAKAEGDQGA